MPRRTGVVHRPHGRRDSDAVMFGQTGLLQDLPEGETRGLRNTLAEQQLAGGTGHDESRSPQFLPTRPEVFQPLPMEVFPSCPADGGPAAIEHQAHATCETRAQMRVGSHHLLGIGARKLAAGKEDMGGRRAVGSGTGKGERRPVAPLVVLQSELVGRGGHAAFTHQALPFIQAEPLHGEVLRANLGAKTAQRTGIHQ
ncbi:MAG: hypothetical protein BWY79_01650 [Actinobacteria bacterium ADurb.Bin444]|nr:MAG: hypothetical protein BWY79_01650 [Actinobacteria bacterium ADurb.Bin444]